MSGKDWFYISWGSMRLAVISAVCLLACVLCDNTTENYYSPSILPREEAVSECPGHTYNKTCCNNNEFQCADGHCIPGDKLCDDRPDCPDQSDEEGCLSVSCSARLHIKCDQLCKDLPGNKSRCVCYKGYARNKGNGKCVDINECAIGVHWCSQDCENLNGTFGCKCREGFQPESGGVAGICKATDKNIQILYSSDAWIYSYSVEQHKVGPVVHSGRVDEMDVDPLTNMVYWSTRHKVGRSYLPGAKNGSVTIGFPQSIGPSSVWHIKTSLAIDWTAKNMYWISFDILNIDKYQILVSKLDGRYVKTIVDDVMFATSLVVDPEHGKMYWTSGGSKAEIGFAWMNGMYRKTLITLASASSPISLTLDHMSAGRLYWADTKTNSIYSVYTDGTRPTKIITLSSAQMPLMMDVFENNLYWVTGESKQLVKYDKFGRGKLVFLVENLINQTTVKVYHPRRVDVHIRQAALYCRNQCSHLCIHVPKGFSCSCPDGSRLLLHQGEILCDTEKEEALEDPLICNCADKEKLCNATSDQSKCHCPGTKCGDVDERTMSAEITPTNDDTPIIINKVHSNVVMKRIFFSLMFLIPVLICCGLSFCKRPERSTSNHRVEDMSSSIGFVSEQDSVEHGFAQGGTAIVKSGRGPLTRNNGVDNPTFQDQDSGLGYMSSTQLLVP